MLEAPALETKRLLLRGYKAGDENDIFRFGSDALTTRFMVWPKHQTIEDSKRALNFFLSGYQNNSEISIGIWSKQDGKFIGNTGFQNPLKPTPWVCWMLCSEYFGQGYATEAVTALLAWGWKTYPAWTRIDAPIHPQNTASSRLAQKLGFRQIPSELGFKMTNLDGEIHTADLWTLDRYESNPRRLNETKHL